MSTEHPGYEHAHRIKAWLAEGWSPDHELESSALREVCALVGDDSTFAEDDDFALNSGGDQTFYYSPDAKRFSVYGAVHYGAWQTVAPGETPPYALAFEEWMKINVLKSRVRKRLEKTAGGSSRFGDSPWDLDRQTAHRLVLAALAESVEEAGA